MLSPYKIPNLPSSRWTITTCQMAVVSGGWGAIDCLIGDGLVVCTESGMTKHDLYLINQPPLAQLLISWTLLRTCSLTGSHDRNLPPIDPSLDPFSCDPCPSLLCPPPLSSFSPCLTPSNLQLDLMSRSDRDGEKAEVAGITEKNHMPEDPFQAPICCAPLLPRCSL